MIKCTPPPPKKKVLNSCLVVLNVMVRAMEIEFHDLRSGILKTKVLKERYARHAVNFIIKWPYMIFRNHVHFKSLYH